MDTKAIRHALCSARYEVAIAVGWYAQTAAGVVPSPSVGVECWWSSGDGPQHERTYVTENGPITVDDVTEFLMGIDAVPDNEITVLLYPAIKRLLERGDAASGQLKVRWGSDRQGEDGAEVRASYELRDGQRIARGTVGIDSAYGSARSILNVVDAIVEPPSDD